MGVRARSLRRCAARLSRHHASAAGRKDREIEGLQAVLSKERAGAVELVRRYDVLAANYKHLEEKHQEKAHLLRAREDQRDEAIADLGVAQQRIARLEGKVETSERATRWHRTRQRGNAPRK